MLSGIQALKSQDQQPEAEGWKFRVGGIETLSMLINRELWFAHPKTFNDPYDCDIPEPDVPLGEIIKVMEEMADPDRPDPHEAYIRSLEHWPTVLKQQKRGYLSLCQNYEHNLMWSHYADSHRGIALGFSFGSEFKFMPNGFERQNVIYNLDLFRNAVYEHRRLVMTNGMDDPQVVESLIGLLDLFRRTKAECWHYEEELRYGIQLGSKDCPGEARPFEPSALKHVIFGLKCDGRYKKTVRQLLSSPEWHHVELWNAQKNHHNMTIKAEKLPIDQ